jgi:hypothetical protein
VSPHPTIFSAIELQKKIPTDLPLQGKSQAKFSAGAAVQG